MLDDGRVATGLAKHLQTLADAVDDWRDWATGKSPPVDRIARIESVLRSDHEIYPAASETLANSIDQWAHTDGIQLHPARDTIPPPTHSIGVEIDF